MNNFYIIFTIDSLGKKVLLNITNDYYYFRRLVKKYNRENKNIGTREISLDKLIEISQFTR